MKTLLTYFVFSMAFNSSFVLSERENIGVEAQQFIYPADATEDKILLQAIFVKFDVEAQTKLNMTDAELINYAKTTFLATGKAAESLKERKIMGNISAGEILKTKIPIPSNIEIHLITLPDTTKLAISFKSVSSIDASELEKIIDEITSSLTLK